MLTNTEINRVAVLLRSEDSAEMAFVKRVVDALRDAPTRMEAARLQLVCAALSGSATAWRNTSAERHPLVQDAVALANIALEQLYPAPPKAMPPAMGGFQPSPTTEQEELNARMNAIANNPDK